MLEEGRYKARGVEGGLGVTGTGKEQVGVLLETSDGERITWHGYFTDGTIDRTMESLRHLGWEGDDVSDLTGIDRNEVEIVVEHEEYEGKVRAKVRWINGGGGLAMKESLDPQAARAFAARVKGAAVASRARVNGAAPPAQRRTTTQRQPSHGFDDDAPMPDDLPF